MDQATELRALVREAASCSAPRPSTRGAARRIVVLGGKGGVGATTIALNLSVALAKEGQRCLLWDAAGGDVALQLRLEPRHTLADTLMGRQSLEAVLAPGPAGIRIVPGACDTACRHDAAETAWSRVLAELPRLPLQPETVIIDAGSRPDAVARQCWQSADRVLLVSTVDTAAVMAVYAVIKQLNDSARPPSIGLLLNRSPSDAAAQEAQQRLTQACRRILGIPLRGVAAVPEDIHVTQCAARGESFVCAAPASAASLALRQAARAMINPATPRKPAAAS